jgi:hypothetical protein
MFLGPKWAQKQEHSACGLQLELLVPHAPGGLDGFVINACPTRCVGRRCG